MCDLLWDGKLKYIVIDKHPTYKELLIKVLKLFDLIITKFNNIYCMYTKHAAIIYLSIYFIL